MKKTIKLIPAIVMLLVSAILVSTSTYAWFSMNNTVTVSGMVIKTEVNSNLLISADTTEAHFGTKLAQAKNGLLEPVSTVDAKTYYYTATDNVVAGGDAKTDVYTAYNPGNTSAFNTNYGTTGAVGYIDYAFYLKATSTVENSKVALTKCNLLYNNTAVGEKAWRVAVFKNTGADDAVSCDASSDISSTAATTILAPASAAYFSVTGGSNNTAPDAVNGTSTLADVANLSTAAVIDGDIDAGITRYYYIVVRLWLEGEDQTCNVETFADLTNDYTLDLQFAIGTSVSGVTTIGSEPSAETFATVASTNAGVTLSDGKLSNGATPAASSAYKWYKVSDNSLVDAATTNAAPTTAGDYYCLITDTLGNVYRTATVTVS